MRNQFQLAEMTRKAFLGSSPWYVILYVTAHCNSKCKFCFYWEQIESADRSKELTLDEMAKISRHLPDLYQLTLTGGEPFMRRDLAKVIQLFYENSKVKRFTLPSNGFFTKWMVESLTEALTACPDASISINFSLDNLGDAHDEVRGLPGNFKRMLETMGQLRELQKTFPNLFLGAATTASSFNVDNLKEMIDFVYDNGLVDNYGIMLARGNTFESESKDFPLEKYWAAVKYHTTKLKAHSMSAALHKTLYETKQQTIAEKRMPDVCRAGEKLIIISERGHVYPCELLPPFVPEGGRNYAKEQGIQDFSFGNLRDCDYDLTGLLQTDKAKQIVKFIQNRGCWCTFECAQINNLFFSPRAYGQMLKNAVLPGPASV
jgi:MoaA/NifB/PqqE/SkfB family radical SAM enzyme